MLDKIECKDGSFLEWVDKETLRYIEKDFSVLVWVDFEPGLLSTGRIIKSSSIKTWESRPEDAPESINEEKRREIIEKIQQYYKSWNRSFRVE